MLAIQHEFCFPRAQFRLDTQIFTRVGDTGGTPWPAWDIDPVQDLQIRKPLGVAITYGF